MDALRAFMIQGAQSAYGQGTDFAVQLAALALLTAVATNRYPTIVQ
jgi:hypothetical protein